MWRSYRGTVLKYAAAWNQSRLGDVWSTSKRTPDRQLSKASFHNHVPHLKVEREEKLAQQYRGLEGSRFASFGTTGKRFSKQPAHTLRINQCLIVFTEHVFDTPWRKHCDSAKRNVIESGELFTNDFKNCCIGALSVIRYSLLCRLNEIALTFDNMYRGGCGQCFVGEFGGGGSRFACMSVEGRVMLSFDCSSVEWMYVFSRCKFVEIVSTFDYNHLKRFEKLVDDALVGVMCRTMAKRFRSQVWFSPQFLANFRRNVS